MEKNHLPNVITALNKIREFFPKDKPINESSLIKQIDATNGNERSEILAALSHLISTERIEKREYLNPEKNTLTLVV